ncbi:hypothetical protein SAMN05421856_101332 [Chryseobacterium taichungense]|uniref:Plasmid recombination enzyme n=1 Tax=Chryseobacterium taichungense TaxID=295069 RepID=A0A1H7VY90_9FLAO|nr:hypothetical protein [Chryseobacterium taichungense]SEM13829.1 hypothetical protein SAMN05421856_101332 [Chryseobacterium taichungense]
MKTSINFKAVKSDSETHNFRRKTFDYIRKDLSPQNEYWQEDKITDRILKIEAYCKEKSGRKLQKNAMPVREAVVVIKEDTTMKDLHDLSKRLQEELGIRVFQITIHKDEGHFDKESKEWKPNLHAHLVADWQDLTTGKTLKHQSFHYSKMQDLAAECLGMERGTAGSVGRLEAVEFKIQKKEQELKALEEKLDQMKAELGSKKFNDLIVNDTNFFGAKQIKTKETITNFGNTFKLYNTELLKNNNELDNKTRQVTELRKEIKDLKRENTQLKSKNTALVTDADVFALEKKKYLDSVAEALEKAIHFQRFKNPQADRSDDKNLLREMNEICKEFSQKNHIPFSALEQIFTITELATGLFSLLRLGDGNEPEPEYIPVPRKKKKRRNIRY